MLHNTRPASTDPPPHSDPPSAVPRWQVMPLVYYRLSTKRAPDVFKSHAGDDLADRSLLLHRIAHDCFVPKSQLALSGAGDGSRSHPHEVTVSTASSGVALNPRPPSSRESRVARCRLHMGRRERLCARDSGSPPLPVFTAVLENPDLFFLFNAVFKVSPQGPPIANRHQPPTANHQPPPTANRQPPPTTKRQAPSQGPITAKQTIPVNVRFCWRPQTFSFFFSPR